MFIKHPDNLEDLHVLANQIDTVCGQLKFTLSAHIVLGLFAITIFWGNLPSALIFTWYILLLLVNLSRMISLRYIPDVYIDQDKSVKIAQWNILAATTSGCLWGLSGLAINVLPETSQYLIVITLVGLSTGAILSNAVLIALYLGFAVPILVLLITGLLLSGGDFGYTTAGITSVYAFFLIYASRQLHTTIRENIQLRIQQERLSEQLSEEKLRFKYVLDSSPNGIVIINENGQIQYTNNSLLRLFGYKEKELVGEMIEILVPDEIKQQHTGHRANFNSKGDVRKMGDISLSLRGLHKDGSEFPVDIGLSTVTLKNQNLTIASVTDLTQHENLREKIQKQADELFIANAALQDMATQDKLTGIGNRRFFDERIDEQIGLFMRKNSPFSLLLIDLDYFKQYNDQFGHSEGDNALQILAQLFKEHSRSIDLLAREEFAIILPGANHQEAVAFAERLRHIIEIHDWPNHPLTISIGVSSLDSYSDTLPPPSKLVKQVVDAADHALYDSKRAGRNRVTYVECIS
ncbi:MAG: diguanylate cyclase [Gammaproteobacteria bacterium]|nr:MAG: diguanylate cyclase [Gammaproteobacteria bacterium]